MPTITIRVSDSERAEIEAAARGRGRTMSDYVRDALRLREDDEASDVVNRLSAVEQRLAKLERLANMD